MPLNEVFKAATTFFDFLNYDTGMRKKSTVYGDKITDRRASFWYTKATKKKEVIL